MLPCIVHVGRSLVRPAVSRPNLLTLLPPAHSRPALRDSTHTRIAPVTLLESARTFRRSSLPTSRTLSRAKSFRMRSYKIACTLTLLESNSYRKTGGVLLLTRTSASLPASPYLAEYKHVIHAFVTTIECRLRAQSQCLSAELRHRTRFTRRRGRFCTPSAAPTNLPTFERSNLPTVALPGQRAPAGGWYRLHRVACQV